MTQALTLINDAPREVTELRFTNEQLQLLKNTIAKGTTDDQFRLFTEVAQRTGLNPFAKQIYAVVRQGQMTVQTGVDGYRLIAQRTGEYAGQRGPEWCGPDGQWRDVWLDSEPPKAARVGVLRHGFLEPVWGVALTKSYQQAQSPLWKTMPEVMIAKCAEVLALRKAFPQELSGLYADEEMNQADSEPIRTVQQPRRKSERAAPPEVIDADTGEIGFVWTEKDLTAVLAARAITLSDLSGILGAECSRETFPELVDGWLRAHAGKRLEDLADAAIELAMNGQPQQPALT